MSKERAGRLKAISTLVEASMTASMPSKPSEKDKADAAMAKAAIQAGFDLFAEFLDNTARIADALEKRATMAPMGDGLVMGELAKFEPAIAPEMVERIAAALENIARRHGQPQELPKDPAAAR